MLIDIKLDYNPCSRQSKAPSPAPPHSNPQNLGMYYVTWQRWGGVTFSGEINVANQLAFK